MSGRLTLSWANKNQALMPDGESSYVWMDRDDPRVTEVRLLEATDSVGETSGSPADNLLIQGDSYDALQALVRTPEYAKHYRGKVKLVYIDPPFNTGQAFEHYDDAMEHSVWLGMMRERLLLVRELLAPDGSVWVHLDDVEMAYCRVLMDEIFGRVNFRNSIIWKRTTSKSSAVRGLGTLHETILFYSRTPDMQPNQILLPYSDEYVTSKYTNEDEKGKYQLGDLTAPGLREGSSGKPWKGMDPTTKRRHWVAPNPDGILDSLSDEATTQEKLDLLLDKSYVQLPRKQGQWPRFKRHLSDAGGVALGDLWVDIPVLNSQETERVGFGTQKPERLLQRIVQVATKPGDIVLDCFGGSGTTAAVAHKMGRRWVSAEISSNTTNSYMRPRLEKVVANIDPGGITADESWSGGGGFQVRAVGPSLYERSGNLLLLAGWAKGKEFAKSVAAQLGFSYEPDGPLSGAKGRTRLAVIDGVVDDVVIKSIVSYLNDEERVTIVAKNTAPEAERTLRELSKGSRLLKAPTDLVRRGRTVQ